MLNHKIKQALLIAGIALLTVFAVAGWTRKPAPPAAANQFQAPYDVNGRTVYGSPANYGQQPAQGVAYAPAYNAQNCPEPLQAQTAAYYPPAYGSAPAYASAPVYDQTRYRTYRRPRVIRTVVADRDYVVRPRHRRSTGKSVAIVGGSAGVGAAIGALAGGGKGAAIGALSGGTAGFIYDRLTHNR